MRTTVITEERIREAIAVMTAMGEKITLRSLRERVGGGSYDKLIAVLRKHEEEERARREAERKQEEARREPPPVIMGRAIELQRQLVRDLWGAAQELAEQQAAGLRAQVEVLTRENMELRQKVDDETAFWREEVAQLELELQRALERAAQAEAEAGAAKGESERLLQENRLLRELVGGQPEAHELLEQVRMLLAELQLRRFAELPAPAAAAAPAADPDRTSEPDSGTPVPATKPKTRKAAAREKKEGGKAKGSETKPLPDNPGPAGEAGGRAKPNEQQQAVVDAVTAA
jgi:hypothetical protein